jgi:hypothetical protein
VSPSALENDLLCDEGSLTDLSEVTHTVCACEQWIIVHDSSLGKHNPQQCGATFGFGHLPFNLTLTHSHTHTHSSSLVLVAMMKSKELKIKISHTHSQILSPTFPSSSFVCVFLSSSHSFSLALRLFICLFFSFFLSLALSRCWLFDFVVGLLSKEIKWIRAIPPSFSLGSLGCAQICWEEPIDKFQFVFTHAVRPGTVRDSQPAA